MNGGSGLSTRSFEQARLDDVSSAVLTTIRLFSVLFILLQRYGGKYRPFYTLSLDDALVGPVKPDSALRPWNRSEGR